MRFDIVVLEYDGDGGYDHLMPDKPPLPGAQFEERWVEDRWKVEQFRGAPYADLVDGKPVLKYKTYESKPEQWWFKQGRNHHREEQFYVRETPDHRWWIEISTLEELMAILFEKPSTELYTDTKPPKLRLFPKE